MAEKIGNIGAIKRYMERDDKTSPGGGRVCPTPEFKGLTAEDRKELGELAIKELGPDFELSV